MTKEGGKSTACRNCNLPVAVPPSAQIIRCLNCENSTSVQAADLLNFIPAHCSGGKRALLCGVSYGNKLKGVPNDVKAMRDLLTEHFKFPDDSILILTDIDESMNQKGTPTRKNMECALSWLVKNCQPGDSLVFYFSGHGLRQPDFNNDELDGYDETLCPSDFKTQGMILDNALNEIIVQPLVDGVKLHAIIDSCHSGTILDLVNVYDKNKEEWVDNSPPSKAKKATSGGLAICFSACGDDQKAADTSAFSNGGKFSKATMCGAMTHTFIQAIRKNPEGISYGKLLTLTQEAIKSANGRKCFSVRRMFHRLILQSSFSTDNGIPMPAMKGGKKECSFCRLQMWAPPTAQTVRCSLDQKGMRSWVYASALPVSNDCKPTSRGGSRAESRRRAVLCGVSYRNYKSKLEGTANDVRNMKALLIEQFHFPVESIRVLKEEDGYPTPTRENMEKNLEWLVKDCQPGDSLVFYFSGHGLRQPNFDESEEDGFDETLCPSDFKSEGMIMDDYINQTIVQPLVHGARLHAIVDACHSGTVLDLPYVFDKDKKTWKQPIGAIKEPKGMAICLSARRDSLKAADTSAFGSGDSMAGALTSAFIQVIKSNPTITYADLLTSIRKAIDQANQRGCLKFRFLKQMFNRLILQEAVLSSSKMFDISATEFQF